MDSAEKVIFSRLRTQTCGSVGPVSLIDILYSVMEVVLKLLECRYMRSGMRWLPLSLRALLNRLSNGLVSDNCTVLEGRNDLTVGKSVPLSTRYGSTERDCN